MIQRGRVAGQLAELGLTFMQAHALRLLDDPQPMHRLAQLLVCDASNVTGITDRLETRGLVERRSDRNDRRVKVLALTEKGRKLRERALALMTQPPAGALALPDADQRALRDILRRALELQRAAELESESVAAGAQ